MSGIEVVSRHYSGAEDDELLDQLAREALLNVDETGHKENGKRLWTWCFRAATYTVFKIDPSRGSDVLGGQEHQEQQPLIASSLFVQYLEQAKSRFHDLFAATGSQSTVDDLVSAVVVILSSRNISDIIVCQFDDHGTRKRRFLLDVQSQLVEQLARHGYQRHVACADRLDASRNRRLLATGDFQRSKRPDSLEDEVHVGWIRNLDDLARLGEFFLRKGLQR
ncbi:MAG: transposase [Planctomycetes bacterium]|nr:transposase [Planctomycetota bacterium]